MLDSSWKVGLQPEGATSLSFRNCNELNLSVLKLRKDNNKVLTLINR